MDNKSSIIFSEICQGYSKVQNFYIKHPSFAEYFMLRVNYDKYIARAEKNGVLKQDDAIKEAILKKWWGAEDEKRIQIFYEWIEKQEKMVKKMNLPRDIIPAQEAIEKDRAILETYLIQRKKIIGTTAEEYALNRFNGDAISKFFYSDENLTQKLDEDYVDEQFDFLSKEYHNFLLRLDECEIKFIAAGGFFLNQLSIFGDDISGYFGVPVAKQTKYQFELLKYSKFIQCRIRNLTMENIDISNDIYSDPQKLIKFCETDHKSPKQHSGKPNTTTIGANFDHSKPIAPNNLLKKATDSGGSFAVENL